MLQLLEANMHDLKRCHFKHKMANLNTPSSQQYISEPV